MPKLTLLAKFSAISFVLLAAIGVLLGMALTRYFEQQGIEEQKISVASLVPPIVGPHLTPDLLKNGASGDSYKGMEAALSYLGGSGLVRVVIWNTAGTIIYSDDSSLIGKWAQLAGNVKQAMHGVSVAEVAPPGRSMNVDQRGYGDLLQVYIPLRMAGDTRVSAVFTGYYDVDDLQQAMDTTARFLWGSIIAGFLFLYISLFTLVRNASQTLVRQSEENAQLYHEARRRLAEREEAERVMERQMERIKALHNIDVAISSNLDQRLTLQVILTQVCTQLHVDAAAISLLDRQTGQLEYAAGRGLEGAPAGLFNSRSEQADPSSITTYSHALAVIPVADMPDRERSAMLGSGGLLSYSLAPLVVKGHVRGVLEIFHREPLQPDREWLDFFETLAGQAAIAVENATLFHDLQHSNLELSRAYDSTLEGWARALELRDEETEGHSRRVTEMTVRLARVLGMPEEDLVHVRRGALLHDIGKMGVPDSVLLKPGPLTDPEWALMKEHPVHAYHLLSPISFLQPALAIPFCHHEKWDGSGYPRGLKGEQIPLAARIFAVIDVYDALTSDRPYRRALPSEEVYEHLKSQAGRHFDPRVVEMFLTMEHAGTRTASVPVATMA